MSSSDSSTADFSFSGISDRRFLLFLGYSALLCAIFAFLGFPRPHVDDPFYVGTAEHLAKTGELYNPYARNWMAPFTPGKFLSQFPLYPFLLAGWMKLAGIGTSSVLSFFAVVNFLCCLFAGWFTQRAKLPGSLLFFLPWMILSLGQTQGFRSDLPGLCAFWISAVCLAHPAPSRLFIAALFASAAVLLWPVLLGFIGSFFIGYLFIHWRAIPSEKRGSKILFDFAALLAGGLCAFVAFLWMIGFEWPAFRHDFLLMTSMRRPGGNSILEAFLGLSWVRYHHLFLGSVSLLSFFFIYWTYRSSPFLSKATRLWIFQVLPGCLFAILLYAVNTQLIYFFFWMSFFAVTADLIRLKAKKELALVAVFSLGLWVQLWEGAKNLDPQPKPETKAIASELKAYPGAIIIFDEIAYRYLFNLQPPANALSWLCFHSAPALGASLADKEPGQIWIMQESRAYPDSQSSDPSLILFK